jgi:flagellar biogenesis protein FliO
MVALVVQLALVTSAVIGLLLLIYFALKQNPRLLQGLTLNPLMPIPSDNNAALIIESRLPLDGKKSLLVVRAGQERYLIGTTLDRIDAITPMGLHAHMPEVLTPQTAAAATLVANPAPTNLDVTHNTVNTSQRHKPTHKPANKPVGLAQFATPPQKVAPAQSTTTHSFNSHLQQLGHTGPVAAPAQATKPVPAVLPLPAFQQRKPFSPR